MSIIASIIIPCKNELNFIEACLTSIISNDFPKGQLEVLVIDGMSTDGTRIILEKYSLKYSYIKFIDNKNIYTPYALNIGINESKGKYVIRMDAHSVYEQNYVSRCVRILEATKVDVVGGPIETSTRSDKLIPKTIKYISSHKFGVGNSSFRTSKNSAFVDTVPFGAYRRILFEKVGFFNEQLIRNQDNEFSNRILKSGGKIYMSNKLRATYFNQESIAGFFRQALKAGYWNVFTLKIDPTTFRCRYFAPLFFVTSLIAVFLISCLEKSTHLFLLFLPYLALNFLCAIHIAYKKENIKLLLTLPIGFFLYHFIYGFGSLIGVLILLACKFNGKASQLAYKV